MPDRPQHVSERWHEVVGGAGAHTFPFRRGGMTAQLIAGVTSS